MEAQRELSRQGICKREKFSVEALELKNPKNQIDCRQPLRKGLVMLGALSFGASVSMLLQGGYGYGNDL
jgi:hypothetical protein